MVFLDHVLFLFYSSYSVTLLCTIGRIASVIMAFPHHIKLLFCSSYSVTLLCTIGRIV